MSPKRRDAASESSRETQLYTVGSLLVALFGVVVLALGFVVFSPSIVIGMGLGGIAVAVGTVHLRRALSATGGEGVRSQTGAEAPGGPESVPERDPIAVLKERYALGDIDDAEFERRLSRLLEVDSADGESRSGRQENARRNEGRLRER